ncbi:MAG: ABC transporter ATP-binding protein [Candidatus Nanopelagicaceae bacterium]
MMAILELENVQAHYGDLQAIFGISLTLQKGSVHSVIGANGAGKSTLLKVIAGSMQPSAGRVIFNGQDLSKISAYERVRRGISLVPEGRRIFPSLTVEENVKVGAYSKRSGYWNPQTIRDLYPLISDRWNRLGFHCSGGELQMLAISRALMANPDLLLIDEASLGLAPIVVGQVYESLSQIVAQGTSVLLVEQNVSQALKASTTASVLLEGRSVLTGKSAELSHEAIKNAYFGIGVA